MECDSSRIKEVTLDTLAYEVVLAPAPTDPHWAWLAIEALQEAGLVEPGEVEEVLSRMHSIKAKMARACD